MFTVYIYSVKCQHNYKVKTSDETGGDPEGKHCQSSIHFETCKLSHDQGW